MNIRDLNIELTDDQIKFLKQFAANQHEGAKDNLATYKPYHVVQTEKYIYSDIDEFGRTPVYLYNDNLTDNLRTAVIYALGLDEEDDEAKKIPEYKPITILVDSKGNKKYIYNIEDYLEFYGVNNDIRILYRESVYEDVAIFFTLAEAQRYKKYQAHNLCNPRVFTKHMGYGNKGEWEPFFDLLMSIGTQLNNLDMETTI